MKKLLVLFSFSFLALVSCQKEYYEKELYYPCQITDFKSTTDTIVPCPSSDGYNCPDSLLIHIQVDDGGKATVSFLIDDRDCPIVRVMDKCATFGSAFLYMNIQDKCFHIHSTVPISGRIIRIFYSH